MSLFKCFSLMGIFVFLPLVFGSRGVIDEIESLVNDFMLINNNPGVGLTIVDEESGLIKGYGLRDRELNRPVGEKTKFLIASISKTFTATIIVKVLSEKYGPDPGILDVPISILAPNYNFTMSDRYLEEKCGFRGKFFYSNAMMVFAGDVISYIADSPFESLVMDFFGILGMGESTIVNETDDYDEMENMAKGYFRNVDGNLKKMNPKFYNGNSGAASGGIITTPDDMGKYLRFHLSQGQVNGVQIIPKEVMNWVRMTSTPVPFAPSDGKPLEGNYGYGLGFYLGIYKDLFRMSHNGDLSPFTSLLSIFPTAGLAIFTVVNGPGDEAMESSHDALHAAIVDVLQGGSKVFLGKKERKSEEKIFPFSPPTQMRMRNERDESFIGLYGHPYECEFEISGNSAGLFIQYGIYGQGALVPTSGNSYRIEWTGDLIDLFYAYNGGSPIDQMTLTFTPEMAIYEDSDGEINYIKNGTLDKFPTIPWDPNSCAPSKLF